MIYYDPTEADSDTRLPQAVIDAGRPLPGLERLTKADILITPQKTLLQVVSERMPPPLLAAFESACHSGVLIQRKSGNDLISSLDDLNMILVTMQSWSDECWLLATGHVSNLSGKCAIGGRMTKRNYTSFVSKTTWWQRRGGYYIELDDDLDITAWIAAWDTRWLTSGTSDVRVVSKRKPPQALIRAGWWEELAVMLPSIGPIKARNIAEWLGPANQRLSAAIVYLTNRRNYNKDDHPARIGPADFRAARAHFMLEPNTVLREVDLDEKGVPL